MTVAVSSPRLTSRKPTCVRPATALGRDGRVRLRRRPPRPATGLRPTCRRLWSSASACRSTAAPWSRRHCQRGRRCGPDHRRPGRATAAPSSVPGRWVKDGVSSDHGIVAVGLCGEAPEFCPWLLRRLGALRPGHARLPVLQRQRPHELDGEPALEVYKRYLGEHAKGCRPPACSSPLPCSARTTTRSA